MNSKEIVKNLKHLGSRETKYSDTYSPSVLEAFSNKNMANDFVVNLDCPEFTSLCPVTGQPDFATIKIKYIPDKLLVESKSLKLYLFSFRNTGEFHESCVNNILNDLVKLLAPKYIEVRGLFTPRGGIALQPFAVYTKKGGGYEGVVKGKLIGE